MDKGSETCIILLTDMKDLEYLKFQHEINLESVRNPKLTESQKLHNAILDFDIRMAEREFQQREEQAKALNDWFRATYPDATYGLSHTGFIYSVKPWKRESWCNSNNQLGVHFTNRHGYC